MLDKLLTARAQVDVVDEIDPVDLSQNSFMLFYGPAEEPLPPPPPQVEEVVQAHNQVVRRRKFATECPAFNNFLADLIPLGVNSVPLGLDVAQVVGRQISVVWKNGSYVGVIEKFDGAKFHVRYVDDGVLKVYKVRFC
jgi:hypothetical protein